MAPPVLIPNTAVKRSSGDDSPNGAKVACRQNRGFNVTILTMLSWSGKRKFIYGGTVIVLLAVAIAIPAWNIFYKAPTCFDGLKNGNELGIDCGGSCTKLCPSAFIPPSNVWTRFEQTAPGLYNVAAYIINPNTEGEAFDVPYHVDIYDTNGIPITKYDSTVTLPPNRNTVAFRSSVNVGNSIPSKAVFQFTGIPDWQKQPDGLSKVTVLNKSYSETGQSSSLSVILKNNDVQPIGRMSVYVILYGKDGNAIGFSSTIIDGIAPGGTATAPYTWSSTRNGDVVSIEVLPVLQPLAQ